MTTKAKAPAKTRPAPLLTQAERDRVHERLSAKCEYDPETDCWIYTGSWHANGSAVCRVANRWLVVARVSACLYHGGFELFDYSVRIKRRRDICSNPACFNPDHIKVVLREPWLFPPSELEQRQPAVRPKRRRRRTTRPAEPSLFSFLGAA